MKQYVKPAIKDYTFVGLQFLLFLAYVLPIKIIVLKFAVWLNYIGLGLAIVGVILGLIALLQINTNISPFPTPVAKSQLITHGTFSMARHPIYTSILTISLGYALYDASLYKFLIFLVLWILFYFKSKYEEQLLTEKFPQYATYKLKTRRFI
ncbi:methyltransferase family protein [Algibacter sp. Ld11]|uniref:methyltransferase family protein n=1 Tax=Algibacter sp. Ld11 TaxID=649150 RepID=UPI003867E8C3